MSRRRAPIAFVALLVGSGAGPIACSLLVDTQGLAGDGALPSGDATREATDDVAVDGRDARDAEAAVDASVCDATFCESFDDSPVGSRWTTMQVDPGTSLGYGTPALSLPNALQAQVVGTTTQSVRKAWLDRDLGTGTRLHCEVAIYVVAIPSGTGFAFTDLFGVSAKNDAAGVDGYRMWFAIDNNGTSSLREDVFFPDGGCDCPRTEIDLPSLPVSEWTRVAIDFDFASVQVSFGGVVVGSKSPFGRFLPAGSVSAGLGVRAYAKTDTSSNVRFDDLRCTLAP